MFDPFPEDDDCTCDVGMFRCPACRERENRNAARKPQPRAHPQVSTWDLPDEAPDRGTGSDEDWNDPW